MFYPSLGVTDQWCQALDFSECLKTNAQEACWLTNIKLFTAYLGPLLLWAMVQDSRQFRAEPLKLTDPIW